MKMRQFKGVMKHSIWIGVAIIGISSMSGCSSNKTASSTPNYEATESAAAYDRANEQEVALSESSEISDGYAGSSQEESEYSSSDTPKINTESAYNRKIIKNGEMTIQTKQFSKTTQDMIDYLQELGGYIEDMDIEGVNFYDRSKSLRTASLKVRVPQKQFDTFVNKGGEFGIVVNLTCSTEDITSSYVDVELRIQTLQTRYDRLMVLMEKSGDLSELFKLEQEISNVYYEIEQYKGTLNKYDALTDMSTLTVQIEEVEEIEENVIEEAPETFMQKIQSTFRRSLDGVLTLLQGVLIIIVGVIPTLIILIPIGILVGWAIKKYLHHAQSKNNKERNQNNDREETKENGIKQEKNGENGEENK